MRVARGADVIWREIDQHGVLLRVSTGDYCEINEVGLFIWRQIETETASDEIARRVAEAFDTDPQTAAADVADFAEELSKRDMAVISGR